MNTSSSHVVTRLISLSTTKKKTKKENEKPTEHQNAFIKNYISAKLLLCKPNKYPNHIYLFRQ